jgi:diaminopimelate epimerase
LSTEQIAVLCDRRKGIGADGLMVLLLHPDYDFEMLYYNADGRAGSLCGNGGRCLTRFASDLGMGKQHYRFLAADGPHEAKLAENEWIHLQMMPVHSIKYIGTDMFLNTGSPHYIRLVENIDDYPVVSEGRSIRYSDAFAPGGTNVNFVQRTEQGLIVRTYGTGVTAAALACADQTNEQQYTAIFTRGGELGVSFKRTGEQSFDNIWLCGPAQQVFTGSIEI